MSLRFFSVQPLSGNGLTLGRVLLLDNDLHKALPEVRACCSRALSPKLQVWP